MAIDQAIRERIKALIKSGNSLIALDQSAAHDSDYLLNTNCSAWLMSAQHIVEAAFADPQSVHRKYVVEAVNEGSRSPYRVAIVTYALVNTLADINAGVIRGVADQARAEVFDDLLDHADHYLRAERHGPAGVLAGVVFEDTIRRACKRFEIATGDVQLDRLIDQLSGIGKLSKVKAKRSKAAASVRTSATHAQWEEFDATDVTATIAITRELIGDLLE